MVAMRGRLKIFVEMRTTNALQLPSQKKPSEYFFPTRLFSCRRRLRFLTKHGRR
jgi:hypothetical protein